MKLEHKLGSGWERLMRVLRKRGPSRYGFSAYQRRRRFQSEGQKCIKRSLMGRWEKLQPWVLAGDVIAVANMAAARFWR